MRYTVISLAIVVAIMLFFSCGEKRSPKTSSGYMDEEEFTPTVTPEGEYKTIDGSANQVQYQGSQEQKSDLDAIDEYAKEHPDF
jgi:hypothetical protein